MKTFEIRSYTKKELALCYFPNSENPHSAVNHLMGWIYQSKTLSKALEEIGYKKTCKCLSPREVSLIIDHLGEP